jgi:hypothetical protein
MDQAFVPEGSVGIALVTNIIWLLMKRPMPAWYSAFREMRADRYLFSLADHTFAEVFNQFETGQFTPRDYRRAVCLVRGLLNPEWPVLPGKWKLATSCGNPTENLKKEIEKCFDLEYDRAYSQATWKHLAQACSTDDLGKPFEYAVGKEKNVRCEPHPKAAARELELEREKWKNSFPGTESVTDLDHDVECQPPLTIRLDAAIKYRRNCEERHKAGDYHPESKNSRNDGIDYNMTWVFMKKLLLCTDEKEKGKGFTGKIQGLGSFQSGWIYRPDKLAEAWRAGSIAKPAWPNG